MARALRAFTLLVAVAALTACTVKETKAPALSGPSELGLSLTLQATPDVLQQDGASQATLTVLARDGNGQPVRNITCRIDIAVSGTVADFGRLSARTVTTGSDGRATVVYTAPPAPLAVTASESTVSLQATPIGTDYSNETTRSVAIRLVPPGLITPPSGASAGFSMAPETVAEMAPVTFNGSLCTADTGTNCSKGVVTSWSWNFGDGGTASGAVTTHTFTTAGSYLVTLTVTDAQGRPASTTRSVIVTALSGPTPAFDISPTNPALGVLGDGTVGAIIYVNASSSKPAVGRQIVAYNWDFGDGKLKTGALQDHTYRTATTFTIVLTVTDDLGRTGTISKAITVK